MYASHIHFKYVANLFYLLPLIKIGETAEEITTSDQEYNCFNCYIRTSKRQLTSPLVAVLTSQIAGQRSVIPSSYLF